MVNKKGFTLIEVLISILIISIVLTGIYAIFIMGKQGVKIEKYRGTALNYAHETLEELKNYVSAPIDADDDGDIDDYVHLPNSGTLPGDTSGYVWAFEEGYHTFTNTPPGFSKTYKVENVDMGDDKTLKKVTITVTYPDVKP